MHLFAEVYQFIRGNFLTWLVEFLPEIEVFLAGTRANVTYINSTEIYASIPPLNLTMYQNMSFFNADGGWFLAQDAVFYTMDCPHVGMTQIGGYFMI